MDYQSVRHCTRNENGYEELETERELFVFEWLWAMLKARSFNVPRTRTETWIAVGTQWVDKATGLAPDWDKQYEIFLLKGQLKRHSAAMDQF